MELHQRVSQSRDLVLFFTVAYIYETDLIGQLELEKLKVFETEILKWAGKMRMGNGESSKMRNFLVCIVHLI